VQLTFSKLEAAHCLACLASRETELEIVMIVAVIEFDFEPD
jgi:hypothetical protein